MTENPFKFIPPPKEPLKHEDRPDMGALDFNDIAVSQSEATIKDREDVHSAALIEQLNAGHATHFDSKLVSSLEAIKGNSDKSAILSSLMNGGLVTLRSLGSKVGGIAGALEAGALSQKYFAQKAGRYLSDRFLVDPNTVKGLPSKTMDSMSQAAHEMTKDINPDVVKEVKGMTDAITDGAKSALQSAKDFITDAGGADALKAGSDMLSSAKDAIASGTSKGVDATVEQVNNYVLQPTIDTTAEAAGWTTYLPAAAIGYLLTSAAIGGVAGVMKERREATSFDRVQALIDKVWNFDPHADPDARLELVGIFSEITAAADKKKYSFTKEEWLHFAAAVREARSSLLREKTKAPEITLAIEHEALKKKAAATERIIQAQTALAQEDEVLAQEILAQYDNSLASDLEPFERRRAQEKRIGAKIGRYSKVFAKSALQGTGLPILWKGVKMAGRAARRALPF